MQQREAVQRMLIYIDEHVESEITLAQLARAAQYSAWHAARLFKEATGTSPFSYIRSLRLSHCAKLLGENKQKVVDIAFQFVFDSHEEFTRAFTKQFGMSPTAFRKALCEYRLKTTKSEQDGAERMETVFVQVIERPKRNVIVKFSQKATDYFSYCEEVGCDVWDHLASIEKAMFEPIGMWMPMNLRKMGTGEYCQGVEVPLAWDGEVPKGFEMICLQACKMMVFQGPAFDDEKFESAITNLWDLIKGYDPSLYGYKWAPDAGPRFQLAPMGYRGYIEALPVMPL